MNLYTNKFKRYGVDPTAKKFKKYYQKDIKILPKIFKKNIFSQKIKFKIITAIAMFYDLRDPVSFCKQIENNLDREGVFHVEVAYLPDILRLYSFDTFCQEHLTYFSFISFNNLIKQTNLKVIDYSRNGINGGSINFDLAFKDSKFKVKKNKLKKLKEIENKLGINNSNTYRKFYRDLINKAKIINSKNSRN